MGIIAIFICILFYVVYLNEEISEINDLVKVVEIEQNAYGQRLEVRYHLHKYYLYDYNSQYELGDMLWVRGTVIQFEGKRIPFGFNAHDYYIGKGIYGRIEIDEIKYMDHHDSIFSIREKLLTKSSNPYVRRLIFAEPIDQDIKTSFESLDILFLLNLSGIHVFALMVIIKKMMFYMDLNEKTQQVSVCLLYAILLYLSKFDLSILRLSVLYIIILIEKHFDIKNLSLNRHFEVFFVMLLLNYSLIYDLSFLMMFMIVITLDLTKVMHQKYHPMIRRYLISLTVVLVMIPFQDKISVINILFMPILILMIGYMIYPLIWILFLSPKLNIIDIFIEKVIHFVLTCLNQYQYSITFHQFNIYLKIAIYAMMIWILLSSRPIEKLKRLIILLMIMMLPTISFNYLYEDLFYMIDVGQGDGYYAKIGQTHIVIDCYYGMHDFLEHHGINKIDYLILTHSDKDHVLEANDIIRDCDVLQVIINPYDSYDLINSNQRMIKAGDYIYLEDQVVEFYNPIKNYNDSNNNSLVFKIHIGSYDFLFTGDAELEAEVLMINTYGTRLKSDVLKVSHHGSSSSTSENFLNMVNPRFAVISVGANNQFGFPSPKVLDKLKSRNISILRTDIDQTVIYRYGFLGEKWSSYL